MGNPDINNGGSGSHFPCPFCKHEICAVKDSRPHDYGVRRRRLCLGCNQRFTTYETTGEPDSRLSARMGSLIDVAIQQLEAAITFLKTLKGERQ